MTERVRVLPAVDARVETGPVRFGDDWPGTFIRGDDAFAYALYLRMLLDDKLHPSNAIAKGVLYGLLAALESSRLNGEANARE